MLQQELYNKLFVDQQGNYTPKDQLKNIINENPYFSIAHFFLLKETENTNHNYRKIAARTALHFNNPFLLRYQLKSNHEKVAEVKKIEEQNVPEEIKNIQEPEKVEIVNFVEPAKENQKSENTEKQNIYEEIKTTQRPEKIEIVNFAEEVQETQKFEKIEKQDPTEEIKDDQKIEKVEAVNFVENTVDAQKTDRMVKDDKKEELLFEPLYTTDYFASQGIKLSEEVQTNDKLGKQLRSFTDWLKTMKRLHHGKLPEGNLIDPVVQNMAEKSNKEQEVITEAMAEVYLQQSKTEKAAEIYRKLSLLNPAKSAYFAAKIELLKDN